MKDLQPQTIELYSKQLRTPMFNQYQDIVRQLDKNQGFDDFLIALMKLEMDSRQESTRRRKIKSAGFPSEWTTMFENHTMVTALIDRLTFRSHVLNMNSSNPYRAEHAAVVPREEKKNESNDRS